MGVNHTSDIIEGFKWDHTCGYLNQHFGQSFYTRELIMEIHRLRAEIAQSQQASSHEVCTRVSIYGTVTQLPIIEGMQMPSVLQVDREEVRENGY